MPQKFLRDEKKLGRLAPERKMGGLPEILRPSTAVSLERTWNLRNEAALQELCFSLALLLTQHAPGPGMACGPSPSSPGPLVPIAPSSQRGGLCWVRRQFVNLCPLLIDWGGDRATGVTRLGLSLQEGVMAIGSSVKGGGGMPHNHLGLLQAFHLSCLPHPLLLSDFPITYHCGQAI